MKRVPLALFAALMFLLPMSADAPPVVRQAAPVVLAQTPADIPLEIKGDVVTVKVDMVIVTKIDRVVVRSLPFSVSAPPGSAFYFWTYPAGVQAVDKGDTLQVTSAAKGPLTISVKSITADWDAKKFLTKFGSVAFDVGDVTPPDPPKPIPPDPKPIPPDPTPTPAPIPLAGLRAIIIYESAELTDSLRDVMSGAKTNDYMAAKGVKGGFPKIDKDVLQDSDQEWVREAGKRTRATLPWLIVSDGAKGYEGPIPKGPDGRYSPAMTLEILRKVGG